MVDVEDLMAWRNGVLLRNIMVVHWVLGMGSMVGWSEEQGQSQQSSQKISIVNRTRYVLAIL